MTAWVDIIGARATVEVGAGKVTVVLVRDGDLFSAQVIGIEGALPVAGGARRFPEAALEALAAEADRRDDDVAAAIRAMNPPWPTSWRPAPTAGDER